MIANRVLGYGGVLLAGVLLGCAIGGAAGVRGAAYAQAGEPAIAAAPSPEALLDEIRTLHLQARDEYSFAMFLDGIASCTPAAHWDEFHDLFSSYFATATTAEPALAFHLKGDEPRRRDPIGMEQTLSYARPAMPELREQRLKLSRLVLTNVIAAERGYVFSRDPELEAWWLAAVELGHDPEKPPKLSSPAPRSP